MENMNADNKNQQITSEKSPLLDERTMSLTPLYFTNNYVHSPLLLSRSPHMNYIEGCKSPATPKYSTTASLPAGQSTRMTPVMQIHSNHPQISSYSSTPVKGTHNFQKRPYTFLTPVSTKPCYPRVLNKKENTVCVTPKTAVYNPFECCPEQFGLPSVSPSMFKEVVSPSEKEDCKFSWAIDHIAILHPANIENSPYNQVEMPTDPEYEARAQEAIDRFFTNAVLPSPWTNNTPARPLKQTAIRSNNDNDDISYGASDLIPLDILSKLRVNKSTDEKVKTCNVWTQSEITLPPILPKEVEDALAPFCTFTLDQSGQEEESNINSTFLRRKLQFSREDLTSSTLKPNSLDDTDEERLSRTSISPIPIDDLDDDPLPWDTSMIPCRSALRLCNLCSMSNLSICNHITPRKLRSSSTGLQIMSPDLSLISWGSPKSIADNPVITLQCPDVSPIEKWSKKTRKRTHSEILSSTTAGQLVFSNEEATQPDRSSKNLPSPIDTSPIQMDTEFSLVKFPTTAACYTDYITPCKMSDSLPFSPISVTKSEVTDTTFVSLIKEENEIDNNDALDGAVNGPMKQCSNLDSDMVTTDGCSTNVNNESRSMFMEVDSQRFENLFHNETNQSQDTGYQTASFQPSYCSSTEQKNESIAKELRKAKVDEKFPNIFGSFNFKSES